MSTWECQHFSRLVYCSPYLFILMSQSCAAQLLLEGLDVSQRDENITPQRNRGTALMGGSSTGFPALNSHSIMPGPEGTGGRSGTETCKRGNNSFQSQVTEVNYGLCERSQEMWRIGSPAGCDTSVDLSCTPLPWPKGTLPVPLLRWEHSGWTEGAVPRAE